MPRPLRFGTDGVRRPAEELTDELVAALGQAAAVVLGRERFVVGRDTRLSGARIERAFAAGVVGAGGQAESLGVVPTPTVAHLSARRRVPAAVISASHNPFGDNGIKFFAPGGVKLSDRSERAIEAELDRVLTADPIGPRAEGADGAGAESDGAAGPVGEGSGLTAEAVADIEQYRAAVVDSIEGRSLQGLHVVVDGANGSASAIAPDVLERLGARVDAIHVSPDGRNINEGCGSTHPGDLQAAVVQAGADVGLAFDGDADRVLAVDERGQLVDGDHLIAMSAIDMKARGRLDGDAVVVTVMANLGFRQAMTAHGIEVVETPVGDRFVLEALARRGLALGGEPSGHVIFPGLATTGDGLLTGVQLLDLLTRTSTSLSDLAASAMTRLPQVLTNVVVGRADPLIVEAMAADIASVEAELGDRGRVLVRPSGTEPVVRVMVEATDEAEADAVARRLVEAVTRVAAET